MKLLLQSDDYGMTRAVARGIIHGIEHGFIRNTGMFTNMPWTEECAEWIKPYLHKIALGVDLNLSTGSPLLPPEEIPSLVKESGSFYTSWESRSLDTADNNFNHAKIEDIRKELEAQIQKYIDLFGKKPDYLHSHAYETSLIVQVHRELASKYSIPYCSDVMEKLTGIAIKDYRIRWYIKPPTLENQANSSLENYILVHSEYLLTKDYYFLIGHMGYVDQELMDLSTYNIYRINDLNAVVSEKISNWIKINEVELLTYKDLSQHL